MAIQVSNARVIPAIEYNQVHLTNLWVGLDESTNPKFKIKAELIMYAVMADGSKRFDQTSKQIIDIDDAAAIAATDPKMAEAMVKFEESVASLLESQLDVGSTTVL